MAENPGQKIKCHMGHPTGNGRRGQAIGRQHFNTKAVRLWTEYMGTRKARVTVHGVPAVSLKTGWRLFFQVWTGLSRNKQSVHCPSGDNDPQKLFGHPRHTGVLWEEDTSDRVYFSRMVGSY